MEEIPFKDYDEIRKVANGFLAKYHPTGAIPVPIESIIDNQLKINIIPMPGLRNITNIEGADAFTYGDRSSIVVDNDIWKNYPNRYHFTLAHEIGHIKLHQQYFDPHVDSIDTWMDYATSLGDVQHDTMEDQANDFAGLVLVPRHKLEEAILRAINKLKDASALIPDVDSIDVDLLWSFIIEKIAKQFKVSTVVIEIRMKKDNIRKSYDLKALLKK